MLALFLVNLTSSLWEEKIIEMGEERGANKCDAEEKVALRVGGWWRREIAYSRFTHLHQTA